MSASFLKMPGTDQWLVATPAECTAGQSVTVTKANGKTKTVTIGKYVATVADRRLYEIAAKKEAAPDITAELLSAAKLALECILKELPPTTFAPRDALRAAIAKAESAQ